MRLTGNIADADTFEPIPGVSLVVKRPDGSTTGTGTTTNSNGDFILDSGVVTAPNNLVVTSVGYKPFYYTLEPISQAVYFEMDKDIKELPPVVTTGTKKNNGLLWAGLALLAAKAAEKKPRRSISGITTGNVVAIGAGVAMFFGFDIIKKMLEGVGIWDSQDTKDVESEISNPNSPFSPLFWKAAPAGALLLTAAQCKNLLDTLTDAFGFFDDDEAQAIGVFKTMKTQSQVSFFSEYFTNNLWPPGADLLTWLQGSGVNDRLSNAEIAQIVDFVKKLPKYKP